MTQEFRPNGFSILPPVVKNLLIINVIGFLAKNVMYKFGVDLNELLGLHFYKASDFRLYQLISYMFMHGDFSHILFNMFALWMFGNTLENVWGSKRFLIYYLICGVGAGLVQELVQFVGYETTLAMYDSVKLGSTMMSMAELMTTVGASGAVYGLLLAFGMLFPNSMIYVYFAIPIKAKWFVVIYGVIELVAGFTSSGNIAHFAHLGGMLFGWLVIRYWKKKNKLHRYE